MKKRNKLTKLMALLVTLAMLLGSFPVVYSEEASENENVTEEIGTPSEDVTADDEEAARIAAEEEAARIAAEEAERKAAEEAARIAAEEAARKAVEEEAARIAAEEAERKAAEEAARKAAEEEAARIAAEEAERKAAEEAARKAAEEEQNEVVAEISGTPAPELDEEPEDEPEDDDWDELDDLDDWDELDDVTDFGDFEEFEDFDAGYISEELLEQFNNPDNYAQVEFSGSADIELKNEGDLHYGDEIVLQAKVQDTDLSYRLVWEANDSDDRGWYTIGRGEEFSYTLSEENVDREYRVVLFTVD